MSEPLRRPETDLSFDRQPAAARTSAVPRRGEDADRVLHQIMKEIYALTSEDRTLALAILKAIRAQKNAALVAE